MTLTYSYNPTRDNGGVKPIPRQLVYGLVGTKRAFPGWTLNGCYLADTGHSLSGSADHQRRRAQCGR